MKFQLGQKYVLFMGAYKPRGRTITLFFQETRGTYYSVRRTPACHFCIYTVSWFQKATRINITSYFYDFCLTEVMTITSYVFEMNTTYLYKQ